MTNPDEFHVAEAGAVPVKVDGCRRGTIWLDPGTYRMVATITDRERSITITRLPEPPQETPT